MGCLSIIAHHKPMVYTGGGGVYAGSEGDGPTLIVVVGLLNSHLRGSIILLSFFCYISRMVTIVLE